MRRGDSQRADPRRPRHCAPSAPRPRRLHSHLVAGAQGRPARHLHRCQQGPASRRLDVGPAARDRGAGGVTSSTSRAATIQNRAGLSGYIAEISAAYLCASLGITPTVRHADYIGSWLEVLREDDRAIVRAASAASKAADFILGFQPDAPQPVAATSADDEREAA